jgi:DNA-directed RNA polymerase subunit beta
MEEKAARDSGYVIIAERSGVVTYVSADMIVIRPDEQKDDRDYDVYRLIKFRRSNQATTINQKPIVRVGDKVKSGDVIADGPAIKNGRLALGKNILVAITIFLFL